MAVKPIENRSRTLGTFRGTVLIHASLTDESDLQSTITYLAERSITLPPNPLPIGRIIGKVNLVHVIDTREVPDLHGKRAEAFRQMQNHPLQFRGGEIYHVMKWFNGEVGLIMADPVAFPPEAQIECKGKLGLYHPTLEQIAALKEKGLI